MKRAAQEWEHSSSGWLYLVPQSRYRERYRSLLVSLRFFLSRKAPRGILARARDAVPLGQARMVGHSSLAQPDKRRPQRRVGRREVVTLVRGASNERTYKKAPSLGGHFALFLGSA